MNMINIDSLIDEIRREQAKALGTKLDWLRLRCLLETEANMEDNVATYKNADVLMNNFLNIIISDDLKEKGNEDKAEIIKILNEKYKTEELENEFYRFLSEDDDNDDVDTISKSWNDNAKVFIEQLIEYRKIGSIDKDQGKQLMDYAKKINNDNLRYIYELIQNADDCEYSILKKKDPNDQIEVKIEIKDDSLIISYPEDGMTYSDIIAITTIGQSNKRMKKKKRIIGEKGRGFKTIFSVCDFAEIHSGSFHFKLLQDSFAPTWIDVQKEQEEKKKTKMLLHFKKIDGEEGFTAGKELFDSIKERYGFTQDDKKDNKENILKNCPIIFTNKIEKLVIEYNNEKLCMQKNIKISDIDGNRKKGTLTVQYSTSSTDSMDGANEPFELECYWYEKDVKFSYEEYISHYKDIFKDNDEFNKDENNEIITYPIILIAPKVKDNKERIRDWSGNMFTYLPTFTNINAPISIHAPFELNEDRSCMWINGLKGDDHSESDYEEGYKNKNGIYTTKWNRRLFSELFVDQEDNNSLLKYAYEDLVIELKDNPIYDYIPAYETNNYNFFKSQDKKYAECVEKINLLCKDKSTNIIFENFKELKFLHSLSGKKLFCGNDAPLYFDGAIDEILSNIDDNSENSFTWLQNYVTNNQKTTQGDIPIIKTISKEYHNILALGVIKAEVDDKDKDNKVEFANELLKYAYDKTLMELVDEKCSDYLPAKNSRDGLKAIKIEKDFLCPNNSELWILCSKDVELGILSDKERCDSKFLHVIPNKVSINSDQEKKDIAISDIYGDFFKNKVKAEDKDWDKVWEKVWKYVYSQQGGTKDINCTFGLYKELMCFFGKTSNWYEYSTKCLDAKSEERSNSNNDVFLIPAGNLKEIWKNKYEEYRKIDTKE